MPSCKDLTSGHRYLEWRRNILLVCMDPGSIRTKVSTSVWSNVMMLCRIAWTCRLAELVFLHPSGLAHKCCKVLFGRSFWQDRSFYSCLARCRNINLFFDDPV